MSVILDEVLSKLICSSCKKYLSVFPVTVYPNKNVLCGRCSAENRNGTRSRLYELVAEQFVFPCINRFDNCRQVLPPSEIIDHENACTSSEYGCHFCADYVGTPYDLLYHMKINHRSAALGSKCFLIEIGKGRNSDAYFYSVNSMFVVVSYQYDFINHNLCICVDIIGDNNENMMHKFELCTVQNKVQYKTGNIITYKWNEKGINIDVSRHKYPMNIIFCKFDVWIAAVHLDKYNFKRKNGAVQSDFPPVLDESCGSALMKFTFDNVSQMVENTSVSSKVKYFVANEAWSLDIKKSTGDSNKQYLQVYLKRGGGSAKKLKVSCMFSLISHNAQDKNISKNLTKNNIKSGWGWPHFISWDDLLYPRNFYIMDDSIKFDVRITVLPAVQVTCRECTKVCACGDNHSD